VKLEMCCAGLEWREVSGTSEKCLHFLKCKYKINFDLYRTFFQSDLLNSVVDCK